jgi:predicted amidohydrolase YtcJ
MRQIAGGWLFFGWAWIATAQAPDMILIHGKILTVDAKDSIVEAVAITQGRIVAVGSTADIQRQAGPGTRVVDLHGLTATPGLIDTHGHYAASGVDELFSVVLNDV